MTWTHCILDGLIPQPWLDAIQQKCSRKEEVLATCAFYYVDVHPEASWKHLDDCLRKGQKLAAADKTPTRLWVMLLYESKIVQFVSSVMVYILYSTACVAANSVTL